MFSTAQVGFDDKLDENDVHFRTQGWVQEDGGVVAELISRGRDLLSLCQASNNSLIRPSDEVYFNAGKEGPVTSMGKEHVQRVHAEMNSSLGANAAYIEMLPLPGGPKVCFCRRGGIWFARKLHATCFV